MAVCLSVLGDVVLCRDGWWLLGMPWKCHTGTLHYCLTWHCDGGWVKLAVFSTNVFVVLPGAELGNSGPAWVSPGYSGTLNTSSSLLSKNLLLFLGDFVVQPV